MHSILIVVNELIFNFNHKDSRSYVYACKVIGGDVTAVVYNTLVTFNDVLAISLLLLLFLLSKLCLTGAKDPEVRWGGDGGKVLRVLVRNPSR